MTITEIKGDLLSQDKGNFLFSVSADFKCDIGYLKDFNNNYHLSTALVEKAKEVNYEWDNVGPKAFSLKLDGLNQLVNILVVKPIYNYIPLIDNISKSLELLKGLSVVSQQIIMPKICCDEYNQLNWDNVKSTIENTFKDVDWDFSVFY